MKAPDLAAVPAPRAAASGEPSRRDRADAARAETGPAASHAPFESFLGEPKTRARPEATPVPEEIGPQTTTAEVLPLAPEQLALPAAAAPTALEAPGPAPDAETAEAPVAVAVLPFTATLTATPQIPAADALAQTTAVAAPPSPAHVMPAPATPGQVVAAAAGGASRADAAPVSSGPPTPFTEAETPPAAAPLLVPAAASAPPTGVAPDQAAAPAKDGKPAPEATPTPAAALPPTPDAPRAAAPVPVSAPPQAAEAGAAEPAEAVEPLEASREAEPQRASERVPAPAVPPPVLAATAADPRQAMPVQTPADAGLAASLAQRAGDWRLETVAPGATRTEPVLPAGVTPQAISEQITLAIGRGRDRRIEVRLDPPELGRVQIQLSRTEHGLHAVVIAERPETQEFLRRNADQLIQDLDSAGYGEVQLDFSAGGQSAPRDEDRAPLRPAYAPAVVAAGAPALDRPQPRNAGLSGLDIRL